jgi:hypothetical protein
MPHDRIKAAARRRMALTGESYAAARREVIKDHKAEAESPLVGEHGPELVQFDAGETVTRVP